MKPISRRSFIEMALALGATAAWGSPFAKPSKIAWRERRDIYPEGVASGDPESDSVLLWTRRPPAGTDVAEKLKVEIAEDGFSSESSPLLRRQSRKLRIGLVACRLAD